MELHYLFQNMNYFMLILLFVQCVVSQPSQDLDYGLVMDVGSSHTQLFVYAWSHRVTSDASAPESKPLQVGASPSIKPGIQTKCESFHDVIEYLRPLIIYGKMWMKKFGVSHRSSSFPIYFKATAGLRVLSENRRNTILSWVHDALSNSSFNPFYFSSDQAVVLNGEQEAMFDWLTVNYLNHNLHSRKVHNQDLQVATTFGSLDLGGQSTQITFEVGAIKTRSQSVTDLHLWHQNYRLKTYSLLDYGTDAMSQKIAQLSYFKNLEVNNIIDKAGELSLLDNINNIKQRVLNPCLNDGYNKTYNITLKYSNIRHEIKQHGNSKSFKCRSYILQIFDENSAATLENIRSQADLIENMTFYAFSAFGYALSDFSLSSNTSLDQIQSYSRSICNMTYEKLNASHWGNTLRNNDASDYLHNRCFIMTYIFSLLHDGYGFSEKKSNIVFVSGDSYSWSQGSMLRDANLLPWTLVLNQKGKLNSELKAYKIAVIITSVSLCVTCIILGFVVWRFTRLATTQGYNMQVLQLTDVSTESSLTRRFLL